MVSAAKMRRAQEQAVKSRNYAQALSLILSQVAAVMDLTDVKLPILRQSRFDDRILVVVMSTNKGLCGALNTNLFRHLSKYYDQHWANRQVDFITVGKKAAHFVVVNGWNLVASFDQFRDIPTSDETLAVSRLILDGFTAGKYDRVYFAYSRFVNTLVQTPKIKQYLPLTKEDLEVWQKKVLSPEVLEESLKEYIVFEPSAEQILAEVIPYALEVKLYQTLLEASASEHSARMVAMRNAHENAVEVRRQLRLEYNKLRQAQVTGEIADIVTAVMSIT